MGTMETQEPEAGYVTIWCPTCGGVAHPATGCVYSPTFIVCGPCVRSFWEWQLAFMAGKGRRRGVRFYDHVNRVGAPIVVPMHRIYRAA